MTHKVIGLTKQDQNATCSKLSVEVVSEVFWILLMNKQDWYCSIASETGHDARAENNLAKKVRGNWALAKEDNYLLMTSSEKNTNILKRLSTLRCKCSF